MKKVDAIKSCLVLYNKIFIVISNLGFDKAHQRETKFIYSINLHIAETALLMSTIKRMASFFVADLCANIKVFKYLKAF